MHLNVVLLVSVIPVISCHRPVRSGSLIDAYRKADCVAPTFAKGIEPPTRGWDTSITIAGGSTATVQGADVVSGGIVIHYGPDGPSVTAVQPGDYIYPSDVRLNDDHDRLYVKARGLAAGIWHETWLYEYDLQKRKQVQKQRVYPDALPPECPMPQK
jgi:hypothetical protein